MSIGRNGSNRPRGRGRCHDNNHLRIAGLAGQSDQFAVAAKLLSKARIELATSWRVWIGSGEFAMSIAPRVSAPSSSRVVVSGSSTWIVPASAAAVSACTIAAWA